MITLTNSSSYKNSANFRDMKELYIHLQYLYSYTIGKFKSLQEKLGDDMEGLSKLDPTLDRGEDCDDDDLEIVEKVTDCIEVSDDDEDALPKKTQTAVPSGKPPRKQNLEPKTGTVKFYASKMPDQVVASTSTLEVLAPVILSKDPKLKSHVVVKLERIEGIDQMTIPTDDDNAEMLEEVENSGVNDETISSDETLVDNNCENKDPVVIENMRNETNTEEILLEASSESTEQDKLLVLEQESESLPEATIPENTDINDKPTEVECFNISDDLVEETSETPTEKVPEPLEGIIGIALDNNSVVEEVELSSTDGDQETVIVEENMETETISEVTDNDLQVTQLVESEEILLTETNVVIKASIDAVINSTFESNTESTLPEEIPLSEKLGECPPAEILEELLEDLETIPELNTKTNGHEPMEITEEILAEAEKMECDLVDKASFVEAVPKMDGNVSLDDVSDGNLSD